MPNTPVRAAAEGMPTNRRKLLMGIAALPAVSIAQTSASSAAALTPAETPVGLVRRLADELSIAMESWMDDLYTTMPDGRRAHWIAHILPAGAADYPVMFENVRARAVESPEQRMNRARRELIDATKAAYPEVTDWRQVTEEDDEDSNVVGLTMILGHKPSKAVRS